VTTKPCPFCGGDRVSFHQGTTFRWIVAECNECGARAGEVRRDTMHDAEADDEAKAIAAWNTRVDHLPGVGKKVDATDRPG